MDKKEKIKYKNKLLKKAEKIYNKEKKYEETLLSKTRIVLDKKECLLEKLKNTNPRYQIFDKEYHFILIENYKKDKYENKKIKKVNKIKKEDTISIKVDLKEDFNNISKFEEFKERHDVPFIIEFKIDEMKRNNVKEKDIEKFKNKYIKLEKYAKKSIKKIEKEMYKKIDKIKPRLLIEEKETDFYYHKDENIIKVISIPTKIMNYINKN